MPVSRDDILSALRQSKSWGMNEQPLDVESYATVLASLPCKSVSMRRHDTLLLTFERELTDHEVDTLVQASNLHPIDESPFQPGKPRLEAFVWWD